MVHLSEPLDCAALQRGMSGLTWAQRRRVTLYKLRAFSVIRSVVARLRLRIRALEGCRGDDYLDAETVCQQERDLARAERLLAYLEQRSDRWWLEHWPAFAARLTGGE